MRLIPLSSITVPADRQRQEFDPERLSYLQNSIGRVGLIQPITVDAEGVLVAGERRLKAFRALDMIGTPIKFNGEVLPAGVIPAVLPNEISNVARFEIELEENIARHDLTWQEQAQALSQLKRLRELQAAQAQEPVPTVADLAQEIHGRRDGDYQNKTRKALIVAKHLGNPEVAKAKSVDDAFKILKRQETAVQNAIAANGVAMVSAGERLVAVQDDCIKWLEDYAFSDEPRFDIICTDPPYGMSAEKFGDGGSAYVGITHEYADDPDLWTGLMTDFAHLAFTVTKPSAHLYVACDIDGFATLKTLFAKAGWRVHRTPLINVKKDANRVPWPQQGPRRSYELVLYAVKGPKPTTAIYSDVFETTGDENLGHGAQKPVDYWCNLLQRSAIPGDRVLDPFAGTGGILVAANDLRLYCTVIEQKAEYFGIILNRLEELT